MFVFVSFLLIVGIIDSRNKTQKRVVALNRDIPPPNEQFLVDFEQLQNQFPVSLKLCCAPSCLFL